MNLSWDQIKNKRVCLVHDWLVTMRGGEKVLEAISDLFPDAPIYTLFYKKECLSPALRKRKIHGSFLQLIPGIDRFYRWLLPVFPFAIRSFNLKSFDLVISSSHCVAKGVNIRNGALHVCYCHTPMRYLWDFSEVYLERFPQWIRRLILSYFTRLRKWDFLTSQYVSSFIANSGNVAQKIKRFYGKRATVIHPPIEVDANLAPRNDKGSFYLIVSAFVPYKRIDLAIDAFNQLEKPLKIIGNGPLEHQLKKLVRYKGIELVGWLNDQDLYAHYQKSIALIFPGEEDFGIAPLEAQMFGKPVIAFGKGGALETVLPCNQPNEQRPVEQSTGIFFYEQNVETLKKTVLEFEKIRFQPSFIQTHAQSFNKQRFQTGIKQFLEKLLTFNASHDGRRRQPR